MSTPKAEHAFGVAAGLFFVALAGFLVLGQIDQRVIADVGIWAKPANFAFATALHFATFAIILRFLSAQYSGAVWLQAIAIIAIAAAIFEVGYIAIQAGRGLGSHFNTTTPFYAAMYSLMALGAVFVLLPAPIIGGLALLDSGATLKPAVRLAIGIGLVGGTILTLVTAFRLGSNGGHFVGTPTPGGSLMPLTGWSLTVGDLRPAHFFATHMMQALPLAGLLLVRFAEPRMAVAGVLIAGMIWSAICVAAFRTALLGRPITAMLS